MRRINWSGRANREGKVPCSHRAVLIKKYFVIAGLDGRLEFCSWQALPPAMVAMALDKPGGNRERLPLQTVRG